MMYQNSNKGFYYRIELKFVRSICFRIVKLCQIICLLLSLMCVKVVIEDQVENTKLAQ